MHKLIFLGKLLFDAKRYTWEKYILKNDILSIKLSNYSVLFFKRLKDDLTLRILHS